MGFHICDQGRYSVLQLLILIVRTCAFQILFPKFSLYKKNCKTQKKMSIFPPCGLLMVTVSAAVTVCRQTKSISGTDARRSVSKVKFFEVSVILWNHFYRKPN